MTEIYTGPERRRTSFGSADDQSRYQAGGAIDKAIEIGIKLSIAVDPVVLFTREDDDVPALSRAVGIELKKRLAERIDVKKRTQSPGATDAGRAETLAAVISLEEAKEIMGPGSYFGPEAVKRTWCRKLCAEEIPPIPFSREELERARELGQFLILRVDRAGDGGVLTMQKQNGLLAERFGQEGKGKILYYNVNYYRDEEFFTRDTPKLQWAFVDRKVIPGSLDKSAIAQTRVLADYVRDQVFRDQRMPSEVKAALREFDEQEAELTNLERSDWRECARRFTSLRLNKLFRRTPAEVLYDGQTYLDNTGECLLVGEYDRTARLSSRGYSVAIGYCATDGAHVHWGPRAPGPRMGVVFSRSF